MFITAPYSEDAGRGLPPNADRPAYVVVVAALRASVLFSQSGCAIWRSTGCVWQGNNDAVGTGQEWESLPLTARQTPSDLGSVTSQGRLVSRLWLYERWHPG